MDLWYPGLVCSFQLRVQNSKNQNVTEQSVTYLCVSQIQFNEVHTFGVASTRLNYLCSTLNYSRLVSRCLEVLYVRTLHYALDQ